MVICRSAHGGASFDLVEVLDSVEGLVVLKGELAAFEDLTEWMDEEIHDELQRTMAPCSEQEFVEAYAVAHREKYGEDFEVNL